MDGPDVEICPAHKFFASDAESKVPICWDYVILRKCSIGRIEELP